jgi:N-acetylated-alpha-linked acidic dipeptidase
MFMFQTPGYPAYENSTRTEGENIPKIPSLPISAANAAKLFKLVEEEGNVVRLVNHGMSGV